MIVLYISAGIVLLSAILVYICALVLYRTAVVKEEPHDYTGMFEMAIAGTKTEYLIPILREGREFCNNAPHEDVSITSRDGLKLSAKLFSADGEAKATFICAHGYRSRGEHDFEYMCPKLVKRGYNVLLISHRTGAYSEGEFITFGVMERLDVEDWCGFVRERFGDDHKTFLYGISMGAATVMMASELPGVNGHVAGIVADCGYTSPLEEFRHVISHDYKLPKFPILQIAGIICKHRAGWGFDDASARRAVANTSTPILFIHGDKDEFVPTRFTYENYEACASEKDILIVPEAAHAMSQFVDPETYENKFFGFADKLL